MVACIQKPPNLTEQGSANRLVVAALGCTLVFHAHPCSGPLNDAAQHFGSLGAYASPGAKGDGAEIPAVPLARQVLFVVLHFLLVGQERSPVVPGWFGGPHALAPTMRNCNVHSRRSARMPVVKQEVGRRRWSSVLDGRATSRWTDTPHEDKTVNRASCTASCRGAKLLRTQQRK